MVAKFKIFVLLGNPKFPDFLEFQIAGNPEFVEIWSYGNLDFHISVI